MKLKTFLVLALLIVMAPAVRSQTVPRTLDIYFIDVEGGAATLIVTPTGESLLVDSGFPGDRDAGRIAHVAPDVAGLKQIDHYLTTHWHRDHVGGIPTLAKLIPIKNFYDHGIPQPLLPDIAPEQIEAYRQTSHGSSVTLRPVAEDKSDNANSVGFLLTFGRFKSFDGGDLTWNIENRLVCPKNLIGTIDVYQADHHGVDSSNNPRLVQALRPRVAIVGSGPHKGNEIHAFATLKSTKEIEGIYQLHRNLQTSDSDNAPADFTANVEEVCQGNFIKVAVDSSGKSYTVSIPAKQIKRTYQTR